MTARKAVDPDTISFADAAKILDRKPSYVKRLVRDGILDQLHGYRGLSRSQVKDVASNRWLTASDVARMMSLSTTRISQLVQRGRLPFHIRNGRRYFREQQVTVVHNACHTRFHTKESLGLRI